MAAPILIVGGGLAGLFCALKLSPCPVTVIVPSPLGQGASSSWAQGGIAAALSDGDTPEKHTADTVIAGAGIVDEAIVLGMAREARARVEDLLEYGVPFDRDLEGHLVQSREAAHSERRIVRVKGDMAGRAIMEALVAAVRKTPSITVEEGYDAQSLTQKDGRISGVIARARVGALRHFPASATVLATGGIGALYAVTTNPRESRGIGMSLAAEAGAIIADPEFVQFHPTAIDMGRDPAPLATEALRGDGATLINRDGARFMQAIHPDAELAPRDIVARGVFAEIAAGRGAFLDCRSAIGPEFADKFPTVHATCMSAGIDPVTQPIPVVPAEHYHMGGVLTGESGRTSLPGLWAAGEVASTGVHGANRLASNSLLEAVVFAARIAKDIRSAALPSDVAAVSVAAPAIAGDDRELIARLRQTMSAHVGVIRNGAGLKRALREILAIERESKAPETRSMAMAALMVTAAATARHESRGGHFRSDYPQAVPALARRTYLTLDDARAIAARALDEKAVA